jgi:rhamnosyl/mannosyltransferase
MRVLHIYKDYAPVLGGIENHLRLLAEGLTTRGHTVTVLVTSLNHRTHVETPQPGLTIIKAARVIHTASTPVSLAMLSLARQLRPDIVHLQFPYPPGDLAALAVPHRPPLVISYQSDIVRQRTLLRVYRPLLELTLHRAARIIASNPAYIVSSPFLRRVAAKCRVVPLGIDTTRFGQVDQHQVAGLRDRLLGATGVPSVQNGEVVHPTAGAGHLLLFVGRLRYYKGLHVLIDALAMLGMASEPGPQLLIAGSGPERERLQARAAARNLATQVHFLGDVSDADLPALYRIADVFVLPAHLRAEAFGLVQVEALASGLPCVSTELGTGTSFVNRHGETGLVVPPDDPVALAAALRTLLADPALRRRYGAAGQQRVAALFTHEQMLDGIEAVYCEALARV